MFLALADMLFDERVNETQTLFKIPLSIIKLKIVWNWFKSFRGEDIWNSLRQMDYNRRWQTPSDGKSSKFLRNAELKSMYHGSLRNNGMTEWLNDGQG